jgi:hypothetical protein
MPIPLRAILTLIMSGRLRSDRRMGPRRDGCSPLGRFTTGLNTPRWAKIGG